MRGASFSELSTFVAVAEQRSFTKAAAQLGLALPTVSQTVRSLEERLGIRLLNRTTRSVALTEAGERLLARLQPALEEMDFAVDTINEFREKPAGSLKVLAARTPALGLIAPLVPLFLAEYPTINLEITVSDARVDLVAEKFDVGIRPEGWIEKDMITKRFLPPFRWVAVAAPNYLDRRDPVNSPADLNEHNCIRLRSPFDSSISSWSFQNKSERLTIIPSGGFTIDDPEFALRTVLDGLGIGYFPEPIVTQLVLAKRLRFVLDEWAGQSAGLFLYYPSRRLMPSPLQTFLAFITANRRLIHTLAQIPRAIV